LHHPGADPASLANVAESCPCGRGAEGCFPARPESPIVPTIGVRTQDDKGWECGRAGAVGGDIICPMNPKPATALLAVSILVVGDIAPEHRDSLVPREHIHVEMHTAPVAATASYMAASGGQVAFDNEAFSPSLPWARWWRADESRMVAVQGMMRLGV